MSGTAIVLFSEPGLATACLIKGSLEECEIWGLDGRVAGADRTFEKAGETLQTLYAEGRTIIGLCAAGILIRALAPSLTDKRGEPPVLAVSDDGAVVVPLLGGLTGANELARRLADVLGGTAAVTASGSRRYRVQLEAPPEGYVLANREHAKSVTAALLAGASARLDGEAAWLAESGLPFADDGTVAIRVSPFAEPPPEGGLLYHPRSVALYAPAVTRIDAEAIEAVLRDAGLAPPTLGLICVPEAADLPAAARTTARDLDVPLRVVGEDDWRRLPGEEIVPKAGRADVKLKIADAPADLADLGRTLGRLTIVGLGPGDGLYLTRQAREALSAADDLVGYETYLDLVPALRPGQRRHASGNRVELDRAREALDLAGQGRTVALVSSGDPGIFAMAAAVMETLEAAPGAWPGVEVTVVPGVSAMQAAAARIGAPLGHDFCAISLSDIRKPWAVIERRLTAAAEADMVIAIYNPASKTRRDQIAEAKACLLRVRAPDTPVVVGRNLGRGGEQVSCVPLAALDPETIDMRTVLLVGSSRTRAFDGPGEARLVYSPRSYG